MKCLVKESKYSKTLREGDINLLSFLQNPSKLPKPQLPLWRFITFKPGVRNAVDQTLYDTIHMLIVEFDTGTTIQAVEAIASDYSYAIHTTSNHSKSLHKFRLMLPLDRSYPEALWRDEHVKTAMREKFPALDRSCFVNFQCIPALPPNPNDYYYNVHNGRKFSYADIKSKVEEYDMIETLNKQLDDAFKTKRQFENINYDAYKAKVDESSEDLIASLPTGANGNRYNSYCSAMGKLLNCKYPDGTEVYDADEVRNMLQFKYWDNSLEKALRSFSRRRR